MKNKRKVLFGILGVICMLGNVSPLKTLAETTEENVKDNNKTYYADAYYAGHDDDFGKNRPIESDDYNYGWELGKFCVSGYSARVNNENGDFVFLKNVGDNVSLTFNLDQEDIHCLNGNSKLYIRELNSRDSHFQTENINFKHGALILRHTDFEGIKHEPIIYENYLEAVEYGVDNKISMNGPDTDVYLLEEGDYEVALDYRVGKEKKGPLVIDVKDPYQDFRIFFKFSVRNGNCMTFIRDTVTGNELTNESVTKNGFVVDMANSKYLQVNMKKEVMSNGRDGLVEDTRYNRPVSDGEKFEDEGMYTLTTKNVYTNEQTIKKIYVGTDKVMIAYVNSQYSIEEINDLLAQGCSINDDGTIEYPIVDTTESIEISTEENLTEVNEEVVLNIERNFTDKIKDKINDYQGKWICFFSILGLLILLLIFRFSRRKARKHSNLNGDEKE